EPLVKLQPALTRCTAHAGHDHDPLPGIEELLGFHAEVLVGVEQAAKGVTDFRPAPRAWLHRIGKLSPLEIRCKGTRAEVAARPRAIDLPHPRHILLRHRLPLEPCGSEGLLVVGEVVDPDYLATPNGVDQSVTRKGLDAAAHAYAAKVAPFQHSVRP